PARVAGALRDRREQAAPVVEAKRVEAGHPRRERDAEVAELHRGRRLIRDVVRAAGPLGPLDEQARLADAAPAGDDRELAGLALVQREQAAELVGAVQELHMLSSIMPDRIDMPKGKKALS